MLFLILLSIELFTLCADNMSMGTSYSVDIAIPLYPDVINPLSFIVVS